MSARPATPGPAGRDMIRSIRWIRRDAPGFLLACRQRWGDVVLFPIPRPPVFLVSHPDAVLRVLQEGHKGYDKQTVQYRALSAVAGQGLLTSDGALWRRQRRLAQPAFHGRTLHAVAERTGEAAGRQLDRWDADGDGAVVDVDAAMMRTTLDVVGQALFGADLAEPEAADALVAAVLRALDVVVARAQSPLALPPGVPTPRNRRLGRALATIDAAVAGVVAARRRAPGAGEPDLLDLLLAATDEDGGGMDDAQLRDELVTALVAGHETVASALTWAWHLLGQHPAWAAAVAREATDVLGGRRVAAYEDLRALPTARAVLEETLRLYPPAWVVTRRALEPDVLGGHDIPAGALVIVSPWVLHRHPAAWADPERFDPGRFLPERRGDVPRGAYLPFGAGPRLCIGRDFALAEGTLLLASLARTWALEPVRADVRVDALVTLRPRDGLPMRLRRRPVPR